MCVICYVPKNEIITDKTIKDMFFTNPDGAGYMYTDGKKVYYKKGFFDVDTLIKEFREIPQNYERVLHFRIATSGGVSVDCCHPFPICGNIEKMKTAQDVVDRAFCHNGVLADFTPPMQAGYNDTMLFNKEVLSKINLNDYIVTFLNNSIGYNKLAIMDKNGVKLIGDWEKENGVYYSNLNHVFTGKKDYGYELEEDEIYIKVVSDDDFATYEQLEKEGCEPVFISENTFSVFSLPKKVKYEIIACEDVLY